MRLALGILNYNDADNTLELLKNVIDYNVFEKIIVVDNASNDDSRVRLKYYCKSDDKLVFIQNNENKGYGAGNNKAAILANDLGMELLLIANPDTSFDEDTVKVLKSAMERNANIGICAPLMESDSAYGSKKNVLKGASCWPVRDFWHSLAENGPVSRRIFARALHYNENFYNEKIKSVGSVSGALLMVRVKDFVRLGGYDENMFLYCEEDVISMKMAGLGLKTAVITGYKYKHMHSASIKKSLKSLYARQKIREESTMYYYSKYLKINFFERIVARMFFFIVRLEVILFILPGRLA